MYVYVWFFPWIFKTRVNVSSKRLNSRFAGPPKTWFRKRSFRSVWRKACLCNIPPKNRVLQFKKKALRVVSFSNRSDPNSTCQAGSKKGCGWPGWHKKMAAKGIKSLPEIKTIQYGSNPKPSGFENSIPPNPLVNHHVPMTKSPSLGSIPHFQHPKPHTLGRPHACLSKRLRLGSPSTSSAFPCHGWTSQTSPSDPNGRRPIL